MKRILTGIIPGIVILLALPYLFIPSTIHQSIYAITHTTEKAAQRALLDESKWVNWWPTDSTATQQAPNSSSYFYFKGQAFRLSQQFMSGIEITSSDNADSIKSLLTIIPSGKDTVKLAWEYQEKASLNPFTRIGQNNKAKRLKKDMGYLIQQLAVFLSDDKNTYGITVSRTTVTDSFLVATKAVLKHEPDVADIYELIDQLHRYATASGAQATNPPMLNKRRIDSIQVEVMVALPVNKALNSTGTIFYRQLLAGKLLVTEVQGGPARVREAFRQLENYLVERRYESPAIPFESLVTNRQQQTDTTAWVTRIYYPVF